MTPGQLETIRQIVAEDREYLFYSWRGWRKIRDTVLKLDRFECQRCKQHGKYSPGRIVHHIKHLRDRPDLALRIYDPDTGERQLITLCKKCHEAEHSEIFGSYRKEEPPVTVERWD